MADAPKQPQPEPTPGETASAADVSDVNKGTADALGQINDEPVGVKFQKPQPRAFQATEPDDDLLFGDSVRPDEPVTKGLTASGQMKVPDDVIKALPTLIEAAKDPSAPPALIALVRLLGHHIQQTGEF